MLLSYPQVKVSCDLHRVVCQKVPPITVLNVLSFFVSNDQLNPVALIESVIKKLLISLSRVSKMPQKKKVLP